MNFSSWQIPSYVLCKTLTARVVSRNSYERTKKCTCNHLKNLNRTFIRTCSFENYLRTMTHFNFESVMAICPMPMLANLTCSLKLRDIMKKWNITQRFSFELELNQTKMIGFRADCATARITKIPEKLHFSWWFVFFVASMSCCCHSAVADCNIDSTCFMYCSNAEVYKWSSKKEVEPTEHNTAQHSTTQQRTAQYRI